MLGYVYNIPICQYAKKLFKKTKLKLNCKHFLRIENLQKGKEKEQRQNKDN